jgi:hypothetical protein
MRIAYIHIYTLKYMCVVCILFSATYQIEKDSYLNAISDRWENNLYTGVSQKRMCAGQGHCIFGCLMLCVQIDCRNHRMP